MIEHVGQYLVMLEVQFYYQSQIVKKLVLSIFGTDGRGFDKLIVRNRASKIEMSLIILSI